MKSLFKASVITILILTLKTVVYWTLTNKRLTPFVKKLFLTMTCMQLKTSSPLGIEHAQAMTSLFFYKKSLLALLANT